MGSISVIDTDEQKTNLPKPIPLVVSRSPSKPYPVDALGNLLGSAAESIADHAATPLEIAANSVLGAASLAAQPHMNVEMDGRVQPLSLALISIAESSDRKSSADKIATKAVHEHQRQLGEAYAEACIAFDNESEAFQAERKKICADKTLDQDGRLEKLESLRRPKELTKPFMLSQEPTLEALQKGYVSGQPSQALMNDEGAQFFGGCAMSEDNIAKTMAGLCKLLDGEPIYRNRAGAGESAMLHDRRLSAHLMAQPVIAEKIFSSRLMQEQGFAARFLISKSESIAGTRIYKSKNPNDCPKINAYNKSLTDLLRREPITNDNGELQFTNACLDEYAKPYWVEMYNRIEVELGFGGELAEIKPMAGKAAGNMLRLAGVMACFENGGPVEVISEDYIRRAAKLMEYYISECLRLTRQAEQDLEVVEAQKLLDWLHKKEIQVITSSDIQRKGPKPRKKADVDKKLDILRKNRWVYSTKLNDQMAWSVRYV